MRTKVTTKEHKLSAGGGCGVEVSGTWVDGGHGVNVN